MDRWLVCSCGVLALLLAAGSAQPQQAQDDVSAWLDDSAVKVSTLDISASFDDLQPLKEILKNARIVQLGEQSHNDGATFRAKARLIRFLHEEMGFDVLAFESGLYECTKANELLGPGRDPLEAMRAAIFSIWHTQEVHDLFRYLCGYAGSDRPLFLSGLDCQSTGRAVESLMEDVLAFVGEDVALPAQDAGTLRAFHRSRAQPPPKGDQARWEAGLAALKRLRAAFDAHRDALEARHGARETGFCSRVLDNYLVQQELHELRAAADQDREDGGQRGGYGNLRDAQMADNLKWLATVYYPDRKIICWAASIHLCHGVGNIKEGGVSSYADTHTMGEYVKQEFGAQVYTIGFSAYDGYAGRPGREAWRIPEPPQGSIEATLHQYGQPFVFIDLQRAEPFSELAFSAPFGYRPMRARWPEILDGLFFIDSMTPSVAIGEKAPDPADLMAKERANLLRNAGAEEAWGSKPSDWWHGRATEDHVAYRRDLKTAHSGRASLAIANTGPRAGTLTWGQVATARADPGRYVLSAFVKTEDIDEESRVAVCVNCRRADGELAAFATTADQPPELKGTNDWTPIRVEFTVPEETASFLVYAFLTGTGKAWFDDLVLAPAVE